MLRHRTAMRRIFVYCHDAYGMGNARRMMAIAAHLARAVPGANLLMASGSPVIHGFRMPERVDYIKLPSVARTDREQYATRYLTTTITDTIRLRSALLKAAVADFAPDLVLVDKKPFGIMHELTDAVHYLRAARPRTRHVLVLRDILDAPDATIPCLAASNFERDLNAHFDMVAVLGTPDVFDVRSEYRLSEDTSAQVRFCGYLRTAPGARSVGDVRQSLGVAAGDRLLLVTPGGGEDGRLLLDAAMAAVERLGARVDGAPLKAVIMAGPHVPREHLADLRSRAAAHGATAVHEFTDDMASFVAAADLVVSMGGYNTVCDILSLAQRAIVVPRVRPVREQSLRAARMTRLGLFRTVHPDGLTGHSLAAQIAAALRSPARRGAATGVDLTGLDTLTSALQELCDGQDASPVVDLRAAVPVAARVREAS